MWSSEEWPRLRLCILEWLAEMVLNSLDRLSLGRGDGDDNTGQGMADGRRKTREGGVLVSKRKMCFKEHMVSSTKCHSVRGKKPNEFHSHLATQSAFPYTEQASCPWNSTHLPFFYRPTKCQVPHRVLGIISGRQGSYCFLGA